MASRVASAPGVPCGRKSVIGPRAGDARETVPAPRPSQTAASNPSTTPGRPTGLMVKPVIASCPRCGNPFGNRRADVRRVRLEAFSIIGGGLRPEEGRCRRWSMRSSRGPGRWRPGTSPESATHEATHCPMSANHRRLMRPLRRSDVRSVRRPSGAGRWFRPRLPVLRPQDESFAGRADRPGRRR